jgi:hypothetical protein
METPEDRRWDINAVDEKEIYREARDFLSTVIAVENDNRSKAVNWLQFRDGNQWPQDLYNSRELDGRLMITINHCDTLLTRVENSIKQQRPRIKAHPVVDADVNKAKLINGLTRHIEAVSQAPVAYDAGASSALSIGWGYWRIVPEYLNERSFDQELKIKPIENTFTVYRDPMSVLPDGSDSMRYLISEKMTRIKFRQQYPNAENVEFIDGGQGDDDANWESRYEIRLAEYFRIVEKPERLFKMLDGTTKFESEFAPGVLKVALADPDGHGFATEYVKGRRVAVERKSATRQVQWFRLSGSKVIDRRNLPGKWIPIIAVEGCKLNINGEKKRHGAIKNMTEPCRLFNYSETMKMEKIALSPKAAWVAAAGQIEQHPEWFDANTKAYSALVYDPVVVNGQTLPPPQRESPSQVEAGWAEMSQSYEHMIMAIAGQPHEPEQDAQGQVVSGVALKQRRALADDSHYHYYDNVTLSIAFTGRILVDLYPHYYDGARLQRIIQEDGAPEMVQLNQRMPDGSVKNDMSVGEYDIIMDTGPGYDTKRQEGFEGMVSLLGTPLGEEIAKVGADLIVRNADFAGADQLADRLVPLNADGMAQVIKELPEQAQSIIGSMQKQAQALQAKVQQLEADLKYGLTKSMHEQATKLQIENLRDQRAEADTHTDAFVRTEDTHTKAQTAIAVAEINKAGTLLDTHVKGRQDEAARKDELAAAERAEKAAPAES